MPRRVGVHGRFGWMIGVGTRAAEGVNAVMKPGRRPSGPRGPKPGAISLRALKPGVFELVHPRCIDERELDYEEGVELRRVGEIEAARDALRFALDGCGENLWVHVALGFIALEDDRDAKLARGHFGYAVELARRAIPAGFAGRLPRDAPANRPFFDALDGLARTLDALGETDRAAELRGYAQKLDPIGQ